MNFKQRIIDKNIVELYFTDINLNEAKSIEICQNIIKNCTINNEYYFGLYREDGNFNDRNDIEKYRFEIPLLFKTNGEFIDLTLNKFRNKNNFDNRISAVGRLPVNEKTIKVIPIICNYYLETIFFEPKKGWEEFKLAYQSNPLIKAEYLIRNSYTDLIFLHADSGMFFILFNTDKIDLSDVIKKVEKSYYNLWLNFSTGSGIWTWYNRIV